MRSSRSRRTRVAPLALLIGAGAAIGSSSAVAEWPPPESATADDMRTPQYWPDDPGYGYDAEEGEKGQWNYFSFIPEPNTNVRPEETASGMSIDLAWRYTTGDPRVLIGVTDSGIKWDEADLVESAWINHRELVNHRPHLEDGTPCGDLDPAFHNHPDDTPAALEGFDCNGDGILTVADYAEEPSLLPVGDTDIVHGDRNNNGILDAGDLILNLSDDVDDDGNGYTDDIAGWDFFKDDNDPYDDTRYGHGTGEGRDSTARANNGMGEAGVCPGCRLVSLRVGDSFITDVNDFAQAVIYATDLNASIVQSALGTINMSAYAQEALDYAYENNVLTVASMADENSRHHNMPTASNHTMPVHAIHFGGGNMFKADSFFHYHPCSNYGGQNFLSGSGEGCSSEAVGRTSGVAGLIYSAGMKYGYELTSAEAMSLFFMTADDVNVPESQQETSVYQWSQPGFDQRFGYGRVNANNAVEWIKEGKIPPAVDITSPTWFSVLYRDQSEGPVDIVGTVSAKRANSYDYVVEWAPGVQPLDDAFTVIKTEENISSDVVMGSDGAPLASLDIRNIDTTHEWDSDSPLGENEHTITVRVRSIAHYGGDVGDVPGELRRTYYVHEDPDLVKGFPIFIGESGEASPKMADIDGDGVRDVVYPTAGGVLHVLKMTPSGPEPVDGFPFKTGRVDGLQDDPPVAGKTSYLSSPAYADGHVDLDKARESLTTSAPAIADLDGDGDNEIVLTTYAGTVYVVNNDGTIADGWPQRLPEVPSCPLDPTAEPVVPCMTQATRWARGAFAAPVIEDMDGDGDFDIIQAAFDGNVYVWDSEGNVLDGWPVSVAYEGTLSPAPQKSRIFTTPAVADFNGDGIPELLVGSNERLGQGGQAGAIYLIDGRGNNAPNPVLPNWPVTMTSLELFPLVAEGITNSGVIGTFDGTLSAVMHGNASLPLILPEDPGPQTQLSQTPPNAIPQRPDPLNPEKIRIGIDPSSDFGPLSQATQPNTMLPLFSQPSLGDMDQDGVPDLIASGGSLNLAINIQASSGDTGLEGDNLLAMWSGRSGAMLPAAPMLLEDFTFFNSSAIADISGDGYPEAIIGSGGYFVHAIDACGREPEGWPKFTGQWIIPTPAVGDIDNDGTLEVVTGTRNGWLYAWHTKASTNNVVEWESYHHDNRNTGNLNVELEQGGPSTAAEPLTEAMCAAVPEQVPDYAVTGGCTCDVATMNGAGSGHRNGAYGLVALIAAAAYRRRRRSLDG